MRLRLPTPGLVGSPHVHSSCLGPVGFAGLLIKCLHFIGLSWAFAQLRPHVASRGLYPSAVWASAPLGWCPPPPLWGSARNYFSTFFVCGHSPPAASRRLLAYDTPVYVILFIPLSLFLISAPRLVLVASGHPLPFIYYIRRLFLAYF